MRGRPKPADATSWSEGALPSPDQRHIPQASLGQAKPWKGLRRVYAITARLVALGCSLLLMSAACVTDGPPAEEVGDGGALGPGAGPGPATSSAATPAPPTTAFAQNDRGEPTSPAPTSPGTSQEGPARFPAITPQPSPTTPAAPGGPPEDGNVRGRVLLQGQAGSGGVTIEVVRITDAVKTETVAEGLQVPWALAFTPDGRILVTERSGGIRVIQNDILLETPLATLNVASVSESGLMGIAVHPDFAANHYIYVCYTYRDRVGRLINRVARLTDRDGTGVDHQVILDDIPGARNHDGCRIRFGPDRKLYVTMGDAQSRENAQDLDSLSGKVLRLEADGSVPGDNPFPGSYVYTYGHRNPQGLDWHPNTGALFITEHGPDRDDEINVLRTGGNYGWPQFTGVTRNDRYVDPILTFTPTVAPAGAAFYSGDRLASTWDGNFIFATLKASHLHRVVLEPPEYRTVLTHQRLFDDEFGRLRAVAMSPDGYLYFTTSNRDGRGRPSPEDDRVLRLVPVPEGPPEVHETEPAGDFALDLIAGTYRLRLNAAGFRQHELRVVVPEKGEVNLNPVELSPIR